MATNFGTSANVGFVTHFANVAPVPFWWMMLIFVGEIRLVQFWRRKHEALAFVVLSVTICCERGRIRGLTQTLINIILSPQIARCYGIIFAFAEFKKLFKVCRGTTDCGSALNMALLAIFLPLFKSIDVTHASCPLLSLCLLYEPRVLLDIFTLTNDARLAAAAVAGVRAVSAVEGE
jgi:hypothetical protein